MRFRLATEADNDLLTAMHHSQGFNYPLPNLNDRSLIVKLITENDDGPNYAALLRLTAEAYLLGSPKAGDPKERWEALKQGSQILRDSAMAAGLDDMYCSVPPEIERSWGRRLATLGWRRQAWPYFFTQLGA